MSWSAAQLRILRELGHEPMQLAVVGAARAEVAGAPAAAPSPAAVAARPAALADAVARAAGGQDFGALGVDLERLRREPALKRALWPKLRALRRPQR